MSDDPPVTEKRSSESLVLPALVASGFSTQPQIVLTALLLIDIGQTFGCSVGVMGQIRTLSDGVAVIFALLLGALSVRFGHRSLLMIGLLFFGISALGSGLAPNFVTMLITYSLSGLGSAMVWPMATTLVAEYFPLENRAKVIGWIIGGAAISYSVGALAIGYIAGLGGWRLAFLGYVMPISLLSLFLVFLGLKSTSRSHRSTVSRGSYLEGFKAVFSTRTAVACLFGNMLSWAAWMGIVLYSASFFRQRFLMTTGFASFYSMGVALCFTVGSLGGGRLVNRFGRKTITVLSAFLASAFIISYTILPNQWLSMALALLGGLFVGTRFSASSSLTLEQVPRFRGTMMSLSSAADSMGRTLGAGVGGLILLMYDYKVLGISLGTMGIAAAILYHLLTIDPTRT